MAPKRLIYVTLCLVRHFLEQLNHLYMAALIQNDRPLVWPSLNLSVHCATLQSPGGTIAATFMG